MNKLIERINMWYVVISFIIFVTFMVFVLPSMSNYMDEKTGGADSPDTSLIYSGNELYDMAEDYGKEGREAYILVRFTFDIVWPLVYTFFLLSTLAYLYKKNRLKPVYIFILFIPLSAMMFDFLENVKVGGKYNIHWCPIWWIFNADTPELTPYIVSWFIRSKVFSGKKINLKRLKYVSEMLDIKINLSVSENYYEII
mgnify:CR=1 FL=1